MLPLTPKALFVGREEETQTYLNFLQQEKQWVFLITGMPGQGKSRFLTHLSTNTPPDVLIVKLDFANHALQIEPLKVLEEIAWRTESRCDSARANLFIETLQDARKQLVEQNFEIVYHLRGPAQKLDIDTKREMQDMSLVLREQVLQAFYAQLSTFHTGRLVLMFDTCEWLNEPDGIETGNWFKDILLPGLHRYVPVSLYIVLASRTQPQFDKIQLDEQQGCELRSLDEVAVNKYMELLGIEHKAQWYDLFTLAHGHPLCMSIIATLWQERQDERTNSDFPLLERKFTEQASIEFFQERLDRRLTFPFRELTHYGVLLRSFDWELLRVIFPELLIGPESYTQFEQFIGYSFIETFEEQGTRRYALHVLLREVMVQTIHEQEPDKWEIYHERAYRYYHEHDSTEQYYHAIALDERRGMSNWQEDVFETLNTANTLDLQLMLEIPHDHTLKLSEHGEAIYSYVHGQYHASAGRWSRALTRYEQALTLFRQLGDIYYEVRVLRAIGDIKQSDKKHWEEALEYYNQALYLTRQQRDSTEEADLLLTIGKVKLNDKDQWSDALEYYNQALALFRVQEKEAEEAQVLQAIGNLKQSENRTWKEAIEYYQQAFHIFQSLQDANNLITILFTIGDVYQQHGHLKQALENYQQALQHYQQLDTQHITIAEREDYFKLEASLYERIGAVQTDRGVAQAAQESYQQSLTLYQYAGDSSGENRILHALHKSQKFAPFRRVLARVPQPMQFALIALILLLIGGSVGGAGFWWFSSSRNTCLPQQNPTQAIGITTTLPSCGSELIGISDGSGTFFYNDPANKDLKTVAANTQQQAGTNYQAGIDAWGRAIDADTGDAESHIYQEDLQVIQAHKPYVTFVVATILTAATDKRDFVGGGRDLLQGAYMAQKANNEHCQPASKMCPLIRLLVANAGSIPSYASYIANQVVLLAKTDPTFVGVTGWGTSAHTLAAVPTLAVAHIPVVASTASSDALTGISPYFFRVNPTDSQQGRLGAQYARQKLNLNTAALFYDPNDAYSNSLATAFQQEFTKEHGKIVNTETYTVGQANNLLNQLRHTLATSQPQMLYFSGYAQDISPLLLHLKDLKSQVKVMGGSALYIPGDYKGGAQNADFGQLYFTSFASPDSWQYLHLFQRQPAFFANYLDTFDPKNTHASTPYGYQQADSDVILTYDAVNVLNYGYQSAASHVSPVTPDDLRNTIAQINTSHPFQGVSGSIAFGQDGNPVNKPVFVLHGSSIDNVTVQSFTP